MFDYVFVNDGITQKWKDTIAMEIFIKSFLKDNPDKQIRSVQVVRDPSDVNDDRDSCWIEYASSQSAQTRSNTASDIVDLFIPEEALEGDLNFRFDLLQTLKEVRAELCKADPDEEKVSFLLSIAGMKGRFDRSELIGTVSAKIRELMKNA